MAVVCFLGVSAQLPQANDEAYLLWSADTATQIVMGMREDGRVGGWLDTRILSTNRSYNYKLRATRMTPAVIRATARFVQLNEYLTDDQTRALVAEAEDAGDTVVLVEIDPREGSGIIPLDWVALLQPKDPDGGISGPVRGTVVSRLRRTRALAGVKPRDYNYDAFWVAFPLAREDGTPLFTEHDREAELIVRIHEKEGRVRWRIPESIRARAVEKRAGARFAIPN